AGIDMNHLSVVMETEAIAHFFSQFDMQMQKRRISLIDTDTLHMVCDAGDEKVGIAVIKMSSEYKFTLIQTEFISCCSGQMINEAFGNLLDSLAGFEIMKLLKENYSEEFNEIIMMMMSKELALNLHVLKMLKKIHLHANLVFRPDKQGELNCTKGKWVRDNDDDDDEFEEAGFEPSSSNNAEKDSSTGTSCFKNRLESASLRDTAGQSVRDNDDDDDEEAGFEPSRSDGAKMDSATGTSCFKNRQERASLKDDDGSVSRNEPSSCAENNSSSSSPGSKMSTKGQSTEIEIELILKNEPSSIDNDDDDEEAGFEPSSSNSAEMDSATSTSCFKNRQERASLRIRLLLASEETVSNEGGGDDEACSEPLSSNALLEKDTSSRTSGYKYREERACKGNNEMLWVCTLLSVFNQLLASEEMVSDGDEEACSEPLSSNSLLEKDTSSCTSGYKYREERASVRGNEGGGDEEACSEPLSSNALLEKDTSFTHIWLQVHRRKGERKCNNEMLWVCTLLSVFNQLLASKEMVSNEGGGDDKACSEPLSSNALLEKDTSSRFSGYKYREERASVRGPLVTPKGEDPESSDTDHDVPVRQPHANPGPSTTVTMSGQPKWHQKLGEDQSHLLKTLFKTNIALRKELKREDCERVQKYENLHGLSWKKNRFITGLLLKRENKNYFIAL
ncbi:hypothetical protein DPMN_071436, partial [Dreissena polymorpha]